MVIKEEYYSNNKYTTRNWYFKAIYHDTGTIDLYRKNGYYTIYQKEEPWILENRFRNTVNFKRYLEYEDFVYVKPEDYFLEEI